ncbi:hypothetical protein [Rummeliibacillus pycnus]|uniref:hypothetical protein n=1 Tax=Rummeliibacillus pycnus TaxID=101070 RepID=UPI003D273E2D
MVGSFLSNCWAAVIAFTIYFLMTFQSLETPTTIIIHSFVVAIIVFLLTYLVRFLIAFVMYSSSADESTNDEENNLKSNLEMEEQDSLEKNSSEIPNVDQAEELAKAVKTMMLNDE